MPARIPRRRLIALLLLASPLLIGSGAAAKDDAQPRFSGTTDVISVEVPVNVVGRDGHSVRGLGKDNFVVYDEGKAQQVTDFEVLDLATAPAAAPAAPLAPAPIDATSPEHHRHFLLLFDLSFSSPTAILKARVAARDFVFKSLHPDDLVAVATYSLQDGPRLVVTFTPDRAQVARGIDTLGLRTPDELLAKTDPLRFVIAPIESSSGMANEVSNGVNNEVRASKEDMLLENMKAMANAAQRMEREYANTRVAAFTRGMEMLARALNAVSGRKQIVLFSQGFDSRLMLGNAPGTREAVEDTESIYNGEIWKADSDNRYGNTQVQNRLFKMLEEFRRADCVVQAIDISGLRADINEPGEASNSSGQEVLFYVANQTGGELFRNANDFSQALAEVVGRTEVTYVLTFERSDLKPDGSFRHLKVEGRNLPSGTRVSYRTGYYAPRPFKDLDPIEKNLLAGEGIASAVPRHEVRVRALVAAFRATPTQAYVPVVLEIDGPSLLAGHTDGQLDTEIYTYASDLHGQMRDFFTQKVRVDLGKQAADGVTKARDILQKTGLKYYGHLDLPPGEYRIRVLVRDSQTGRTGVEALPLVVPSYDAAQPYLLPPLFMAAQQGWMMVRERTAEGQGENVVYPFTVKGEPYVPAAHPVLAAGGHADLCLVGYNLGEKLAVQGQVLGSNGAPLDAGKVALVERTATGVDGFDKLLATFDPIGLAAGDYVLQVAVKDTKSGKLQKSSLPFTIR